MSATSAYLENLIEECGGFSRFQWIMVSLMMYSIVAIVWSLMMMTFAGAIPDWQCRFTNYSNYNTIPTIYMNDSFNIDGLCYPPQNVTARNCQEYKFSDSMNTIVSEWTLVCDKDWVSSTIMTIQMAGLLISCVASGHLADLIGRKPTYFLSLALLTVLNIVAGFSSSWKMFAACRFLLGFSVGASTVFYTYLIEFIPARRRSAITAFPVWALWTCVLAFMAMWLHDWSYLHFSTAVLSLPSMFMWRFFPESFRYLITHNRLDEAKEVVRKIARINGKPEPDMSKLPYLMKMDLKVDADQKYTMWDVAKSPQLRKCTCLLGIAWLTCGYGYYAISFGVQSMSGNIYINIVLLSVVEMPAQVSSYYLTNRFGRKRLTIVLFLAAGITGFVVAALQISDLETKDSLINGFALASKMCVGVSWATLTILSTESYPTVVRNIGFGILNAFTRIGALIAPQLLYLSNRVPGTMYFVFGGLMILSTICLFFIQETNKKPIEDGIATGKQSGEEMESFESNAII